MAPLRADAPALPIEGALPDLLAALQDRSAAVVVAPPGAGKTTRVPGALLDNLDLDGGVLVLQPRRVAARLTAARIAWERGGKLGEEVGYQVRFERKISEQTRLTVLTEGLLVRRLLADPFLEGVGAVVLDEFHERSVHADLALALLREVQSEARPDLRLVVMSATLDGAAVADALGGCPVVHAQGRRFPVEIEHRPHSGRLEDAVSAAALGLLDRTPDGHVLCFLPGVSEINRCQAALADRTDARVLPLHGRLSPAEQDRALAPSQDRKIVLSTNLAETSVTLDGVVGVVDSGLARAPRYVPRLGTERLETVAISKAAAAQRAGRAGRTGPGHAVRLWSETEHARRDAFEPPEIRQVDLCSAVLTVLSWGTHPDAFRWIEAPPTPHLADALSLLEQLGALEGRQLTPLGRRLAALPVHPRLGRVVQEGQRRGCLLGAAGAAALASERDPWDGVRSSLRASGQDDLLSRIELLEGPRSGAHPGALQRVRRVRDQLLRAAGGRRPRASGPLDEDAVLCCLLAGFPDRVALRRSPRGAEVHLSMGRGARLEPPDQNLSSDLLIAVEVTADHRGLRVRQSAPLSPHLLNAATETVVVWDADSERVVARRERRFGALVLESQPAQGAPDPLAAAATLAEAAAASPARALDLERAEGVRARLAFVRHHRPDLDLPTLDPVTLLPQLCQGKRSFKELRALPLGEVLLQQLPWQAREALDRLAPVRLRLPSGSTAALRYGAPDTPPALPARIQQLFGLDRTPAVLEGSVPVVLELLAPNNRPAQTTSDLPGFWRGSYTDVRKDLRGRYPKHAWPEEPWTATAEDRPRRKR